MRCRQKVLRTRVPCRGRDRVVKLALSSEESEDSSLLMAVNTDSGHLISDLFLSVFESAKTDQAFIPPGGVLDDVSGSPRKPSRNWTPRSCFSPVSTLSWNGLR